MSDLVNKNQIKPVKTIKPEKTDIKHPYFKKREGKLASQYYSETNFAKQKKLKIILE